MTQGSSGKHKIPIEIQHLNGQVTLCFIRLDSPNNLYQYMASIKDFVPITILSNEMIYIAKSDVKAFRLLDKKKLETANIWSFDPYTVLSVERDVTIEELHEQYIALLKLTHPDIIDNKKIHDAFKDVASDITRRIINAYEFIRTEKMSQEDANAT